MLYTNCWMLPSNVSQRFIYFLPSEEQHTLTMTACEERTLSHVPVYLTTVRSGVVEGGLPWIWASTSIAP